jgi:hypothetical protein
VIKAVLTALTVRAAAAPKVAPKGGRQRNRIPGRDSSL